MPDSLRHQITGMATNVSWVLTPGEAMWQWLSDPWVTGIGGGIVSGLIVYPVSQRVFTNRSAIEYRRNVQGANREVLYALRAGITESALPNRDVIEALLRSTAKKYAVGVEDVYDLPTLCDDLIKEVMDSSFISARQKLEFSAQVNALDAVASDKQPAIVGVRHDVTALRSYDTSITYRRDVTTYVSLLIGAMTAVMTTLVAFIMFQTREASTQGAGSVLTLTLPTIAALLVVLLSASAVAMSRYWRRNQTPRSEDFLTLRRVPPAVEVTPPTSSGDD